MLFQNFTSNQQTFPSYIVLILLCQRHYFITGITPPPKRPFEYITSGQNHLILVKSSTTPRNSFWYNHRRHARHVRHLHAPLQTLLPSSLLSPSSSSDDDSSSCSEKSAVETTPAPAWRTMFRSMRLTGILDPQRSEGPPWHYRPTSPTAIRITRPSGCVLLIIF